MEHTQGTETSHYLQEEKEIIDSPSSGERKGKSPNRRCYGSVGVVGPLHEALDELEVAGKRHRRG